MYSKSDPSSSSPPSYSESIRSPEQDSSGCLPQNIALARKALVLSLLTTYITPHFRESLLTGLTTTTLIIIPSNVSCLQPPAKVGSQAHVETVVGFPSAENLTMIRLEGQKNSLEFWRQVAVVKELEQQLRIYLQDSGYRVVGDNKAGPQRQSPPKTDWSTVHKETPSDGEASIQVETKEISLRAENDMGLYETKSGKALVINMNVAG